MEPAEAESDKLIGEVLASRYQIETRLGEGAMGAVYKARHVKVGRLFAVKILHKKLLEDKKVAQRFEREAELAGRLRHPNVIGVVDVGETTDGTRYMVMDFAEGDDLATLLTEAPMPPERVIQLSRQILDGLYHAHENGLIHRDLKPENIIVERDDHGNEVPRLVDFGIAILREGGDSSGSDGRLTTNGLVLGTPHYMAPEQAVADPIDHRIDLFALGIVIYEMLCGKLPFDGTGAEVARANLLLDPPPIAQRVPYLEVDPLLEAFARLLMQKKREQRPETAKAAREILDLIAHDRPAASKRLGVAATKVRIDTPTAPRQPMRVPPVVEDTPSNELAIQQAAAGAPSEPAPPPPVVIPGPVSTPMQVAPAAPTVQHAAQQGIPTDMSKPFRYSEEAAPKKPNRRGLIIAIAGAVAAVAIVLALTMGGGKEPTTIATTEPVVMTPTPPPDPTPTLPPDPTPIEQPAITETGSGSGEEIAMTPDPVDVVATPGKKPVKNPGKKPNAGSGAITAQPAEPTTPETPEVGTPTKASITARYSRVGTQLSQLEKTEGVAAMSALRVKFRRIDIQKWKKSPELLREADRILDELESAIHKRGK